MRVEAEFIDDYNQVYKRQVKEATDTILMNAMHADISDLKDYKEEVCDWSWDSIMKGD